MGIQKYKQHFRRQLLLSGGTIGDVSAGFPAPAVAPHGKPIKMKNAQRRPTLIAGTTGSLTAGFPAPALGGTIAPPVNLTLSASTITITTTADAGTFLFSIIGVPDGIVPTITPNDGRFAIGGNPLTGWTIVTGDSARSAGRVVITVAAAGAISASGAVVISAAVTAPTVTQAASYTDNGDGTLTGNPAVFGNSAAQVDQWFADFIPLGFSTPITKTNYSGRSLKFGSEGFTKADRTGPSTPSLSAASYQVSGIAGAVFSQNFNGVADNTPLTSLGFSGFGDTTNFSQYYKVSSGHATALNNSGNGLIGYSIGNTERAVELRIGSSSTAIMIIAWIDSNNFVGLTYGANPCQVLVYVNGSNSVNIFVRPGFAPSTGDRIRGEVRGGKLYAAINDVYYDVTPSYGTPALQTGAGYTLPTALAANSVVGVYSHGINDTFDDFVAYNLTLPFGVSAVDDSTVFATPAGRTVTLTGSYTGAAPTGIDVGFAAAGGAILRARAAANSFTASAGTWTATVVEPALLGTAVDGATIYAQAWKAGDPVTGGQSKSFTAAIYAPVSTLNMGVNLGFPYSSDSDYVFKDAASKTDLQLTVEPNTTVLGANEATSWGAVYTVMTPASQIGMGLDNKPHNYLAGQNSLRFRLPDYIPPEYAGTFHIRHNQTGAAFAIQGPGITAASNLASGDGTVTLAAGFVPGKLIVMTGGSFAAGGLSFSAIPSADDSGTFLTNSLARAEISSIARGYLRPMTGFATNYTKNHILSYGDVPTGSQFSNNGHPLNDILDVCVETGLKLWATIPDQSDAGYWHDFATAIAAHPRYTGHIILERSNEEPWNGDFPQGPRESLIGYNLGYNNENGDAGPQNAINLPIDGNGNLTASVASGQKVFAYINGNVVLQAKSSLSSGAAANVPSTRADNAYWTFITDAMSVGGMRYKAEQSVAMKAAMVAVLGANRVKLAIMDQQARGFAGGLKPTLDWKDTWKSVDIAGVSSYCGAGEYYVGGVLNDAGATLGGLSCPGGTHKVMGSFTDAAGYNDLSSYAAFRAGFTAQSMEAIRYTTRRVLPSIKHWMERWLRTKTGYVPNSIVFGSYEGGPCMLPFSGAWNYTTLNNYWAAYRNDTAMGDLWAAYSDDCRNFLGGPITNFVYAQSRVSSQNFSWGMTAGTGDRPFRTDPTTGLATATAAADVVMDAVATFQTANYPAAG